MNRYLVVPFVVVYIDLDNYNHNVGFSSGLEVEESRRAELQDMGLYTLQHSHFATFDKSY